MLPIGDFYTMEPKGTALTARLLGVKRIIPMHYGTFLVLIGTPTQLKDQLCKLGMGSVEVIEMTPGQTRHVGKTKMNFSEILKSEAEI
jgi:L-ascorbate metabolism protein UlaG (beta-lactamase superfamily)